MRLAAALAAVTLLSMGLPRGAAEARPATAADLPRLTGDYRVAVTPRVFGFIARGDTLYLRMDGVQGTGRMSPLLAEPDGRFVLSEGHPNAFQFGLEADSVRFTLWGGDQSFAGWRVDRPPPPAATAAAATPAVTSNPTGREPAPAASAGSPAVDPEHPPRTELRRRLAAAAAALAAHPADGRVRFRHARLLYQAGAFWRARDETRALLPRYAGDDSVVELAARLAYLTGELTRADTLYARLAELRVTDPARRVRALVGRLLVCLQQGHYQAAKRLDFPPGAVLPNLTLAASFAGDPYVLDWPDGVRRTEVPFRSVDPLPVLPLRVNGKEILVLLDTGADLLYLDTEVARELGLEEITNATGQFGGGLPGRVGFARVDSVEAGRVSVRNVPVMILPTRRFSFDEAHAPIGGIVGTAFLRQFLATVDYAHGRLVLRERSADMARKVRGELGDRLAAEVPFVLDATHLLLSRGSMNGVDDLTLFVDSGLASNASCSAPEPALRDLGIPVPTVRLDPGQAGGGGGAFAEGFFSVSSLGLGRLVESHLEGEFGALTPETYWARGFIQDGLISHRFLRRCGTWTLDFDSRTFLFGR